MRSIPLHPDVAFIGLVWEMKEKEEVMWGEKETQRRRRKEGWEERGEVFLVSEIIIQEITCQWDPGAGRALSGREAVLRPLSLNRGPQAPGGTIPPEPVADGRAHTEQLPFQRGVPFVGSRDESHSL